MQEPDRHELSERDFKVRDATRADAEEIAALLFGWKVCKHVKSNAIVFARARRRRWAVGAGQMSRVDSVKIAVMKAQTPARSGSVVASDAFFPFPDGVEEAARAGATAVIQPGGSVRDAEVIAAANRSWIWRWCSRACATSGTRDYRAFVESSDPHGLVAPSSHSLFSNASGARGIQIKCRIAERVARVGTFGRRRGNGFDGPAALYDN